MKRHRIRRLWREWRMVRAAPLVILVGPESVMTGIELRDLEIQVAPYGEVSNLGFMMHDNYPKGRTLLSGPVPHAEG